MGEGLGIKAVRAATAEEFDAAMAHAMTTPGPHFIEAVLG